MPIPTYYFAYKNSDGSTTPITINDWATKTLSGADLINCQTALTRQAEFKTNLRSYLTEYVYPFTTSITVPVKNVPPDYSEISESVIYRLYNFSDFLIEYEIKLMADKFTVNVSSIDADILTKFKHTLKARMLNRYLNWYLGTNGDSYPVAHAVLKYDGTNAHELGLDEGIIGASDGVFNNAPTFPDPDWDKYWDMFLKDPNVTIVNPN